MCAPSAGGSAATEDELRRQIRARLSEARLPAVDGVSSSSRGTGRPCVVCGRAIQPTEVERQAGGLGVFLYAHEACYKLWREESVVFRATKDWTKEPCDDLGSLSEADGVILGRLQAQLPDRIIVGDIVLFLTNGTHCDHALGTALRVTYTEREGIRKASGVVRAEW